jgi:competence protein ComEC
MNVKRLLTIALAIYTLIALFYVSAIASPEEGIEVSFINVGQGDSALISDYTGHDVLIDGGKSSAGSTVVAYIREKNVDDIDVMVASHADSDHIGGLINVLNSVDIPVEKVIYNGYPGDTDTWNEFVTAVENEGLTLEPAQFPLEMNWGETTAYILNPLPGLSNPDQNDVSVVVLLDHSNIEYSRFNSQVQL